MKEVTVKKAFVEVKVLKIGNRQVTQSFIRQIPQIIDPVFIDAHLSPQMINDNRFGEDYEILGWVNYNPDFEDYIHRQAWMDFLDKAVINFNPTTCKFSNVLWTHKGVLKRSYIPISWARNIDQLYISV